MTLAHERTSDFLEGTRRARREIITPEGVSVPVDLAEHGGRAVAFAIDLFIWMLMLIAIYILIVLIAGHSTTTSKIAISIGCSSAFWFARCISSSSSWHGEVQPRESE